MHGVTVPESPSPGTGGRAAGEVVAIQYLRGIAAAAVVLYHIVNRLYGMGFSAYNFEWLQAGVDIFFIISGFIMWYSQSRQPGRGAGAFLKDRIARVVPLYWVLTLAVAVLLLFLPTVFGNSRFEFAHIVKSLFFIPTQHPVAGGYFPLLLLGWTLNYEMFFYLLFAIAIAVSGGRAGRRLVAVTLPLLALVVLGLFSANPPAGIMDFYANNIMLEFVFGLLLSVAWLSGRVPRSRWWWLLAVAGVAVLVWISFSPPEWRGVLYGVPSLMIVAGLLFAPAPSLPPLKLLGDTSYSLYLSHLMVIAALAAVWKRLGLSDDVFGWALFVPAACIATVTAGWLTWKLIEQPGTRWAKRMLKGRPSAPLVLPHPNS